MWNVLPNNSFCVRAFFLLLLLLLPLPYNKFIDYKQTKNRSGQKTLCKQMSMTKENTVKNYTTSHKELTCCQWSRCPAPVLSACCQTAPTPASPADWNHPAWISPHSPADHTPGRVQTFAYHYQLSQSECPEGPPSAPFSPTNHPVDHTFSTYHYQLSQSECPEGPPSAPSIILWIIHLGQRFDCHYELYL